MRLAGSEFPAGSDNCLRLGCELHEMQKKTAGPGFHTNRGERVYDLPPDKLSIINIETSHQK